MSKPPETMTHFEFRCDLDAYIQRLRNRIKHQAKALDLYRKLLPRRKAQEFTE